MGFRKEPKLLLGFSIIKYFQSYFCESQDWGGSLSHFLQVSSGHRSSRLEPTYGTQPTLFKMPDSKVSLSQSLLPRTFQEIQTGLEIHLSTMLSCGSRCIFCSRGQSPVRDWASVKSGRTKLLPVAHSHASLKQ